MAGIITDAAGRPLAGARLAWRPDPPVTRVHAGHIVLPAIEVVEAGADGAVEIANAPGAYLVGVRCPYGGSVSVLRALVADQPEQGWAEALAAPADGRQLTWAGARELIAVLMAHPVAGRGTAWAP